MKKYFFWLMIIPMFAWADTPPVSFNFAGVPLVTFAQATFTSILGRDYVISPDVVAMDKKITIQIKFLPFSEVSDFVENILLKQGITTSIKDDVYYLDAASSPDEHLNHPTTDGQAVINRNDSASGSANVSSSIDGVTTNVPIKIEPTESVIYITQNRPSDFIVDAVKAGFGNKSATASGDRVILTGSVKSIKKIEDFAKQLDVLPKTVEISASWVEVTNVNGSNLGISAAATLLGAKFSTGLGSVSTSALSITGTNFQFVLDALNSDSRFKQVSSSRILGDEYQKINLTVGDETPTVSSTSTNTAGNPVQNIVYRPSGVIVDVLPKVLGSGKINISLDGQISSFTTTVTGVNGSPTLVKRQVKTVVTIGDGDVLVIGGLNDASTTKATSGLIFLPSSWSTHNDSESKTDLVLVLSAKVINSIPASPTQ